MSTTSDQLLQHLDDLGIKTSTTQHEAVFTVEQARALRGEIPGGHCKNLFLKDKKGAIFLLVAEESTPIDMKGLHRVIGSARLSFGKPELLEEVLGITPGSVTPFAVINDRQARVGVVLDAGLMQHDMLNFHPLENTATTTIASRDLLKFLKASGHEPRIMDLATVAQATDNG